LLQALNNATLRRLSRCFFMLAICSTLGAWKDPLVNEDDFGNKTGL
jgi:hypothetical protein